eukprot:TRINITY_DN14999_c0_g1_i1.p2 TRINITY_DN14999_c0_g1~~TRINITY_DN14999_c0_g1_i1.p2  ORF type:complete len:100 (+),score=31.34 TRINITY_DN14999_c0_g1_i1:63-362(+)
MIRRPPRSTLSSSSAASDVYKRQYQRRVRDGSAGMERRDTSKRIRSKNDTLIDLNDRIAQVQAEVASLQNKHQALCAARAESDPPASAGGVWALLPSWG